MCLNFDIIFSATLRMTNGSTTNHVDRVVKSSVSICKQKIDTYTLLKYVARFWKSF